MLSDYFSLAFKSLRRRRLRSWLTMLGIFIGIAAVVSLISLGQGLEDSIKEQFESFGSDRIIIEERGLQGPPGSGTSRQTKLTSKDVEVVREVNGVEGAAGILVKTAQVEQKDDISFVFIFGIPQNEEEKKIVSFFDVGQGRNLRKSDTKKAVVGIRYTEGKVFTNELKVGDKIKIEGDNFEIVGILERIGNPFDDSAIIIPKEEMKKLYNLGDEESSIHVKVEDINKIDIIKENIENDLRKSRNEKENKETFQVRTSEQILDTFSNIFGIVQAVLVGIAAISLLVGGIGIANTMYTSVLERTKEIGIMKAIGATNKDIFLMFLIESGILGLLGGIIGIVIGLGLSKLAEYYAVAKLGTNLLQASTDPFLIFGALLFSFLIGSISGIFPAWRASKLKIVDALRYE
ncbi:MAG: ABC transporter permease [Candidatus Pacearchaeota archaeon]